MMPRHNDGYMADVSVNGQKLRLFVTLDGTGGGWAAQVFDRIAQRWVADEWVSDPNQGKLRAEEVCKSILGACELPEIVWTERLDGLEHL